MLPTLHMSKRKSPRAPIAAKAQVACGLERYDATVSQISEGGFRLDSEKELPKARLVVSFDLPGHGPQRVLGEVCWQKQLPRAKGTGCAFRELPAQTQTHITTYVKRMKQVCTELQLALAMNKPRALWNSLAREAGVGHLMDRQDIKIFLGHAMEQLQSGCR